MIVGCTPAQIGRIVLQVASVFNTLKDYTNFRRIREQSIIWDVGSSLHSNSTELHKAWPCISKQLKRSGRYNIYNTPSEHNKRTLALKWKTVEEKKSLLASRRYTKKYTKRNKSGDPGGKPYVDDDCMDEFSVLNELYSIPRVVAKKIGSVICIKNLK